MLFDDQLHDILINWGALYESKDEGGGDVSMRFRIPVGLDNEKEKKGIY